MSRIRSQYLPFALVRVQGGMAVAEKVVPAMYGLMLYRLESASVKPHTLQLGRLEMCAWLCCQPGRASGCGHAPSEEFKDGFLAVLVVRPEGKLDRLARFGSALAKGYLAGRGQCSHCPGQRWGSPEDR